MHTHRRSSSVLEGSNCIFLIYYYISIFFIYLSKSCFNAISIAVKLKSLLIEFYFWQDQQHLVDFVNSKRQGNFDSFFIGLICDTTQRGLIFVSSWAKIHFQSVIGPGLIRSAYTRKFLRIFKIYVMASRFASLSRYFSLIQDPWDCTDQENASFLLTPEGKWRELMRLEHLNDKKE